MPAAQSKDAKTSKAAEKKSLITAEVLAGLVFRNIGPALMSGRISDIVIHPKNKKVWYVAAGWGGVWKTENAGTTWTPVFDDQGSYSIGCLTIDPKTPETVWAGTGENISGAIDPTDPNMIYVEWQEGNLLRYDKKSHEAVSISPQPVPGDLPLRFNWDSPVLISPHSHARIYYAGQFIWRSENRGDSWTRISPELTRGIFRLEQKIMGKQWSVDALWDHGAMSMFSTITTISESPLAQGLIYVGTDDGLIQVTEDGGKNWRKIDRIPGLPDFFFVNEIKSCRYSQDTVFAAVDNHKTGDFKPYLLRSDDRGRTWTNIAGDMPERQLVWSLAQDPVKKDLLFAGTEFGIYVTMDAGKHWAKLSGGVPTISFRDIEVQERECDLVGASFGRGFFVLDDYSPLRLVDESSLAQEAILFPVKKALPIFLSGRSMPAARAGWERRSTLRPTRLSAPCSPIT